MHDPLVLVFTARRIGLDVWHREPGGRDSFEVCRRWPGNDVQARLAWTLRHARHLRLRWWPWINVRRWLRDRCAECGCRFRWREVRSSFPDTDRVWHDSCMSLRTVRGQLADLTGYVLATADANARWRAEYRLNHLSETQLEDR